MAVFNLMLLMLIGSFSVAVLVPVVFWQPVKRSIGQTRTVHNIK